MLPPSLPPEPLNAPTAEVRTLDDTTSALALITTLWGIEDGDKMRRILLCESGLRQLNSKGEVLMSPTNDIGISQIHIGKYANWSKKADDLGYDLTKTVDNISMAYYIWNVQGFKAWACAKKVGVI